MCNTIYGWCYKKSSSINETRFVETPVVQHIRLKIFIAFGATVFKCVARLVDLFHYDKFIIAIKKS